MTDDRWIVVARWDEFQHPDALRTGNLPWLKTFTRLLSDSSYLDLNAGERAVLHGIWLEYARSRGQLRLDTESLHRRLSLRVTMKQLDTLNQAGFITFSASRPASTVASKPASPDKKREERPSRARAQGTPEHCCPIAICGVQCPSERRVLEHLENVHNLEGQDALDAIKTGRT